MSRDRSAGSAGCRWARYYVLLVLFLYAPLVVIVVFSFNDSTIPALPLSGFTTRWYDAAFNDPTLIERGQALGQDRARNAIVATALGVIGALGLAARRVFLRPAVTALLLLPLVVPYIVLAIGHADPDPPGRARPVARSRCWPGTW